MGPEKDLSESISARILENAYDAITIKGVKKYGPPKTVFEVARSLNHIYGMVSNKRNIAAHEEAIHMAIHKLARIACGEYNLDNYVDMCGYIALAGEIIDECTPEEVDKDVFDR